jgi:hypothetical protein
VASIHLVSLAIEQPIAGYEMSIPAKEVERNRGEPGDLDFARARTNHAPHKTQRRQTCATIFNALPTARPSVVRSVRESLAWSVTTHGERPSVQRNALTDSRIVERTTADFYLGFRPRETGCGSNSRGDFWKFGFLGQGAAQ